MHYYFHLWKDVTSKRGIVYVAFVVVSNLLTGLIVSRYSSYLDPCKFVSYGRVQRATFPVWLLYKLIIVRVQVVIFTSKGFANRPVRLSRPG